MLTTDQPWYLSSHELQCLTKSTEPIPKAPKALWTPSTTGCQRDLCFPENTLLIKIGLKFLSLNKLFSVILSYQCTLFLFAIYFQRIKYPPSYQCCVGILGFSTTQVIQYDLKMCMRLKFTLVYLSLQQNKKY